MKYFILKIKKKKSSTTLSRLREQSSARKRDFFAESSFLADDSAFNSFIGQAPQYQVSDLWEDYGFY
jgi:hypothetical protein